MWYIFLLMGIGLILLSSKFPQEDDNELNKISRNNTLFFGVIISAISLVFILMNLGILAY